MANESKYARQLSRISSGSSKLARIWPRTVWKADGSRVVYETDGSTTKYRVDGSREYFRFLDLPRELRDIIYEFALVAQDNIQIRAVGVSRRPAAEDYDLPTCQRLFRSRLVHRLHSTFGVTYELNPQDGQQEGLNLQTFQLSKQVHREASKIFYGSNTFEFCPHGDLKENEFSNLVGYLFLSDRPPLALANIQSLSLILGHDTSIPAFFLDSQSRYMCQQELVHVIRMNLQLKSLSLTFLGWPPDIRTCPWNWKRPSNNPSDMEIMPGQVYSLIVDELCHVQKLTQLSLSIENWSSKERINRLIAFVELVRPRLLLNGDKLGVRNITVTKRHVLKRKPGTDVQETLRTRHRLLTITCDDNSKGKSLADPLPSRVSHGNEARMRLREEMKAELTAQSYSDWLSMEYESRDYTASDGGSQDSLITLGEWRDCHDIHPDWGDGSKEAHGYDEAEVENWLAKQSVYAQMKRLRLENAENAGFGSSDWIPWREFSGLE